MIIYQRKHRNFETPNESNTTRHILQVHPHYVGRKKRLLILNVFLKILIVIIYFKFLGVWTDYFTLEAPSFQNVVRVCRALRPRGSLYTRILGLWPKPRARICLRRRSLRLKGLCWKIKRWDLVMIAPESVPRMKMSSARLSQGPRRWFISKGGDLGNSVGADKHCRDIR